ncbi:MAG: hypothetical protein OXG05_14445 [Gammaproteobacteria bacterium]|nr:hypothetical protein [Gammaproteobacteria bacterium]
MFKTPVVLCAVPFSCLHLIVACNALAPPPLDDFAETSSRAIARELFKASRDHFPDRSTPIFVQAESAPNWLRNALIDELITNQYPLASETINSRYLTVSATKFGTDALHITLAIDGHRAIERVFRFKRDESVAQPNSIEDRFVSVSTLRESNAQKEALALSQHEETRSMGRYASPQPDPSIVGTAPDAVECTSAMLQQGSLKKSLVQILQRCGWQLASWPVDPQKAGHEIDWLVPGTQTLSFKSLEELVRALRIAFDLKIEFNDLTRTVKVQLRDR